MMLQDRMSQIKLSDTKKRLPAVGQYHLDRERLATRDLYFTNRKAAAEVDYTTCKTQGVNKDRELLVIVND